MIVSWCDLSFFLFFPKNKWYAFLAFVLEYQENERMFVIKKDGRKMKHCFVGGQVLLSSVGSHPVLQLSFLMGQTMINQPTVWLHFNVSAESCLNWAFDIA